MQVTYRVKSGMRDAFLEEVHAAGIPDCTRMEEGNLEYEYFFPAGKEDEIRLMECWESGAAIRSHLAAEHAKMLTGIKERYVLGTEFRTFKVIEK